MLGSVRFRSDWGTNSPQISACRFFCFVDRVCAEGGNASLYHGFVFLWRALCAVIRRKLRKIGAHNLRREVTVLGEDQQSLWIGAPRRTAVRKFGCRGDERPGPHKLSLDRLLLTNDVVRQQGDYQRHQYRRAEHSGPIHVLLPVSILARMRSWGGFMPVTVSGERERWLELNQRI